MTLQRVTSLKAFSGFALALKCLSPFHGTERLLRVRGAKPLVRTGFNGLYEFGGFDGGAGFRAALPSCELGGKQGALGRIKACFLQARVLPRQCARHGFAVMTRSHGQVWDSYFVRGKEENPHHACISVRPVESATTVCPLFSTAYSALNRFVRGFSVGLAALPPTHYQTFLDRLSALTMCQSHAASMLKAHKFSKGSTC
jgi:hypothetical protein